MPIIKIIKDYAVKLACGDKFVPQGLFDASEYFRHYQNIQFEYKKEKDSYVAISNNFKFGSIVTSGKDIEELEKNIKDAILTAFDIPSSYTSEINIHRVGEENKYALA